MCTVCREPVRSYAYRFHPPESSFFERCISLSWCSGCRIRSSALVHIPRRRVLTDALAGLPVYVRADLRRSEQALIEHLDAHGIGRPPAR
ncbi:hypothetical protein ABT095_35040 [Kitasatospora sp. NPDC002227]|uniref:hypothetical protein n=1 Tax=Kitasatospora sp. NPDC002227 TaxID=3154773 RepID=UPI00331B20EC